MSNPEVRVKVIGSVVLDDKVWWRATIRIDAPHHLVYLFAYHQYVGLLRPMQFAGIPPAPTFRAIIEAAIRLEVERAWEELRNVTFAMEDPGPHIPGDEDDPEMAPDVPVPAVTTTPARRVVARKRNSRLRGNGRKRISRPVTSSTCLRTSGSGKRRDTGPSWQRRTRNERTQQ